MKLRSTFLKTFAPTFRKKLQRDARNAVSNQRKIFHQLLKQAADTRFGRDHSFSKIKTHEEYEQAVPVRDYEGHKPYVQKIINGEADILWKGFPLYFAKTSGTTSGAKYIPVTKDSISNHINGARNALINYSAVKGNYNWCDGKLMFLSGSPELETKGEIQTGRLSGIVNHHVPSVLRTNQLPTYRTNCMPRWQQKLDAIIDETVEEDMRLISGIPPWIQMYFDQLIEKKGQSIGDIFPKLDLLVHGGVNFAPYEKRLRESVGRELDILELYPASEGFFAFDDFQGEGLLLNTNAGIFFEFVHPQDLVVAHPERYSLDQVEIGKPYALVLSSNAGLWSYSIGDMVEFTSLEPYRIKVVGRVEHFISAFGEHVIDKEVCAAIQKACDLSNENVNEFTVAPNMGDGTEAPYHEWFIEFGRPPRDLPTFIQYLNRSLCEENSYYEDVIKGEILQSPKIVSLPPGSFHRFMEARGKLGGQNKIPRLANDRRYADELEGILKKEV